MEKTKRHYETTTTYYNGAFYIHKSRHLLEIKTTDKDINKIDVILKNFESDFLHKNLYKDNNQIYLKIYFKEPIKDLLIFELRAVCYQYAKYAYFRTYNSERTLTNTQIRELKN